MVCRLKIQIQQAHDILDLGSMGTPIQNAMGQSEKTIGFQNPNRPIIYRKNPLIDPRPLRYHKKPHRTYRLRELMETAIPLDIGSAEAPRRIVELAPQHLGFDQDWPLNNYCNHLRSFLFPHPSIAISSQRVWATEQK